MIAVQEGMVQGFLHTPEVPPGALALTHGAGANCEAPLLMKVAEAFCAAGFAVLRFDLPFRQKRRFGPPSPASAAMDREGIQAAAEYLRKLVPGDLFLGGHSYGGRQTTMLAAENPEVCRALLLFSYPLHPPGKPAQLRTAHFPSLRTPAWFVHGSKDDFGSPEEMRNALKLIPAQTELTIVESAGHDLRRGIFALETIASRFSRDWPALDNIPTEAPHSGETEYRP